MKRPAIRFANAAIPGAVGPVAVAALLALAAAAARAQDALPRGFGVGLNEKSAFVYLFLMLGPIKLIPVFAAATKGMARADLQKTAFSAAAMAAVGLLVAGTMGTKLVGNWNVSLGALLVTAGVVLFLVALDSVMRVFEPPAPHAQGEKVVPKPGDVAFKPVAFPGIVTPYGVAILVALLALPAGIISPTYIAGALAGILVLDVLAMLFAREILSIPGLVPLLGIIGSVLGVLQAALGIQGIVGGLWVLGIVPGP